MHLQGEPGPPGITGPVGPRGDPGELVTSALLFADGVTDYIDVSPVTELLSAVRVLRGGRALTEPMGSQDLQETSCSYR